MAENEKPVIPGSEEAPSAGPPGGDPWAAGLPPDAFRDGMVGALAAAQNRVVSTAQLRALNISKGSIQKRVGAGSLIRVTRGVYLVGVPLLDWAALRRTGLLLAGSGSRLDSLTAAQMRGILPVDPRMVTVSRPSHSCADVIETDLVDARGRPFQIVIKQALVEPRELEVVDDCPATSVPRTLLDIAGRYPGRFERAWREAQYLNLIDWDAMKPCIASTRRDGTVRVNAKVDSHLGSDLGLPESPAEYEFVQMLLRAGVPAPLVNHQMLAGGQLRRPDLLWLYANLIVEIDGWRGHRSREAFEDDALRDADFLEMGILTMRFTARYAMAKPRRCADLVLQQLRARTTGAGPGGSRPFGGSR